MRHRVAVGLALASGLSALGCQAAGPPARAVSAAASAPASSPLAGTSWRAEEIQGRRAGDEAAPTITFEGSARAAGSTGCNRYGAPLDLTATTLHLGEIVMTRRACPAAVMEQEQRFVAALAAARAYRLEGTVLLVLDEQGRPLLRLSRS